jgi:hypothetical protein
MFYTGNLARIIETGTRSTRLEKSGKRKNRES